MARLLTLAEAAERLGVPRGSLETAARKHGYIVRMGRARRIDPNDIEELVRKCRDTQKDHGCTATPTESGPSATMVGFSSQPVHETVAKLKALSRGSSTTRADRPPGQLHRIK